MQWQTSGVKVTTEDKNRIVDYFEAWELALWLRLPIEDVVEYFQDEIEDKLEDLNEFMGYHVDDEDTTEAGL